MILAEHVFFFFKYSTIVPVNGLCAMSIPICMSSMYMIAHKWINNDNPILFLYRRVQKVKDGGGVCYIN